MTPFTRTNQLADRAFWLGPQSASPSDTMREGDASRSDHGESVPSCDPAGSPEWPLLEGKV